METASLVAAWIAALPVIGQCKGSIAAYLSNYKFLSKPTGWFPEPVAITTAAKADRELLETIEVNTRGVGELATQQCSDIARLNTELATARADLGDLRARMARFEAELDAQKREAERATATAAAHLETIREQQEIISIFMSSRLADPLPVIVVTPAGMTADSN